MSVRGRSASFGPAWNETRSGASCEGHRQLLVDDLVEEAATDGEVRVPQAARRDRERGGDAVRPAEMPPVGAELVLHPLGERVAEGDEGAGQLGHGPSLPERAGTTPRPRRRQLHTRLGRRRSRHSRSGRRRRVARDPAAGAHVTRVSGRFCRPPRRRKKRPDRE